MIEIQCPSCQTRYRIDEGVLPQDSPTFKCSRCGHVFSGDPRLTKRAAAPAAARPRPAPAPSKPPQPQDVPAAPSPAETEARSGPSQRPMAARTEAAPSPAQRSSAPARDEAAADPNAAPGGAASEDLLGGLRRPPQPNQTSSAAAPSTTYAQPPRAASSSRSAPSGRGGEAGGQPDNPLARSFADEEGKSENLSFDFGDDSAEQHQLGESGNPSETEDRYDRWHVGDPERDRIAEPLTPETARYRARRAAVAQASRRIDRASIAAAEASEHSRLRSGGFVLGLFGLIVVGFAVFTFVLGLSPSLSREILAQLPIIGGEFTPAQPRPNVVSLREVHAEYRLLDGKRRALIVSGQAENRGAEPLHTIEVGVSLIDNQHHPVLSQSVFCGDLVSPKIVSQMTPHELQFFQKLAPPKNFALKSGDSSPFFVMFINPPPNVADFQISVLKAEPASGEGMAAAGI
jgi:predicted Zn finger-like uncharacterized protein